MGIEATLTIHGNGYVNAVIQTDGVLNEKVVPFSTIVNTLLQLEDKAPKQRWETTPLLPPNTLLYSTEKEQNQEEALSFLWGPEIVTSTYHNTIFPAIPLPTLVVFVKLCRREQGKSRCIEKVMVAAAKEKPGPDTPLYRYPFPNVFPNGRVCTGTVRLPVIEQLVELPSVIRLLFSAPISDDLYQSGQTNLSGLCCRELLEAVNGQPEFPKEYLAPLEGVTLAEWYQELGLI